MSGFLRQQICRGCTTPGNGVGSGGVGGVRWSGVGSGGVGQDQVERVRLGEVGRVRWRGRGQMEWARFGGYK